MIKVTIELESAITGQTTKLGEMHISNRATGTRELGNYYVTVSRKGFWSTLWGKHPMNPLRRGEVLNYPRLSYNVWRLVARALLSAFPEEKP